MSVRELERFDELLLGDFVRGAFNHDDIVFSADVNKVEVAHLALGVSRVRNELAVDPAHPHCTDRTCEWDIGNAERGGRTVDRENIRIVLAVSAEQSRNDLRVVKITRGKDT